MRQRGRVAEFTVERAAQEVVLLGSHDSSLYWSSVLVLSWGACEQVAGLGYLKEVSAADLKAFSRWSHLSQAAKAQPTKPHHASYPPAPLYLYLAPHIERAAC